MERKITIPGEITLAAGLLMVSFSISLMVQAGFGISTISSLPYALSRMFDELSFGTWNLIFQASLLMILLAITKRFKSGYVISFIIAAIFGFITDLFTEALSSLPTGIWFELSYFVVGYLIMCVGIAMMVGSKIPLMIFDSFVNDLSMFFHVTYRRVKTLFDIVCLGLSIVLPMVLIGHLEGAGIGTVILALITGAGVQEANKLLGRAIVIKPWSKRLSQMA